MATPIPRDRILRKLPSEILDMIFDHMQVDEADLWRLIFHCKGLSPWAERPPHRRAAKDPIRGKHVLLWAADTGNHRILEAMLKFEVDPNAAYYSFLPKNELDNVFTAQRGRGGAIGPQIDRHLADEIEREMARRRPIAQRPRAPTWTFLYYNKLSYMYGTVALESDPSDSARRDLWRWSALHFATSREDERAVRLLLEHGADVNQLCSGIFDPSVPRGGRWPTSSPEKECHVWNALHISILWGYESITEELLKAHSAISKPVSAGDGTPVKGSTQQAGWDPTEWTDLEKSEFPKLLRSFGTNWSAIGAFMRTKTRDRVEGYYRYHKDSAENADWESIAQEADAKAARGERRADLRSLSSEGDYNIPVFY